MKKNNKGFSLVELIVVIAIMGVLASALSIGYSVVTNQKPKNAAKEIKSSIQTARTMAMSKTGTYGCRFIKNASGELAVQRVQITYGAGGAPVYSVLDEITLDANFTITAATTSGIGTVDDGIVLIFEKSSGAFKNCTNTSGTDLGTCSTITIKRGSTTIKLNLSKSTGKVEIEY